MPTKAKTSIQDLSHDTVPATVGLVKEIREELRADIRSVDHKVDALREEVRADIRAVDHKVDAVREQLRADIRAVDHKVDAVREELRADIRAVDHKVDAVRSDLKVVEHTLNSKIDQVVVAVHRTQVLMEEQRGENRIVLDGIKTMIDRQDRLETDVGDLRSTVINLKARA